MIISQVHCSSICISPRYQLQWVASAVACSQSFIPPSIPPDRKTQCNPIPAHAPGKKSRKWESDAKDIGNNKAASGKLWQTFNQFLEFLILVRHTPVFSNITVYADKSLTVLWGKLSSKQYILTRGTNRSRKFMVTSNPHCQHTDKKWKISIVVPWSSHGSISLLLRGATIWYLWEWGGGRRIGKKSLLPWFWGEKFVSDQKLIKSCV